MAAPACCRKVRGGAGDSEVQAVSCVTGDKEDEDLGVESRDGGESFPGAFVSAGHLRVGAVETVLRARHRERREGRSDARAVTGWPGRPRGD